MKLKYLISALIILISVFMISNTFTSCTDDEDEIPDVDLTWTEEGNSTQFSGVDNDGDPYDFTIEIVSTLNGESEAIFVDQIEGDTLILEFKATEEGIYDYVLFEGDKTKPSTLVEYAAAIGTRWEYTVASGTVVRRELIEKGNIYKVLQSYPSGPYQINTELEWEISPQEGIVALTLINTDGEPPVRIELN